MMDWKAGGGKQQPISSRVIEFPNDIPSSSRTGGGLHKDTNALSDLVVQKKKKKKVNGSGTKASGRTLSPGLRQSQDLSTTGVKPPSNWVGGSPTSTSTSKADMTTGGGVSDGLKLPPINQRRGGQSSATATATEQRLSARTPPPQPLRPGASAGFVASEPLVDPFSDGGDDGYTTGAEETASRSAAPAITARQGRIKVVVRKRPLAVHEDGEDCVEITPPVVHVGATKQRVDLTEYVESHHFAFDQAFDENASNEEVYKSCAATLLDVVFEGGSASCFAYGQTGSGKTHTMIGNEGDPGLYIMAAQDIFARLQPNHRVFVSLYEIYCNSLFDLLNSRNNVVTREDANKKINICGLSWHEVTCVSDLQRVIDRGAIQRRTGSTSANEYSSRSHAVMTITVRDELQPKFLGSLNVVDLAGSERAADTAANDKHTRLEGAEINKSLLALKECIRGLDERKGNQQKYIPFRGSKLTEVLRDSFVGNSRTVMVANISPCSESAEHTLNTLRYAFRVKGLSVDSLAPNPERNAPRVVPRSKSVDPSAQSGADKQSSVARERKKKKSRERKSSGRKTKKSNLLVTPRLSQAGFAGNPSVDATQFNQMKEEMLDLKSEIMNLRKEKERDVEEKQSMHKLMEEMKAMYDAVMGSGNFSGGNTNHTNSSGHNHHLAPLGTSSGGGANAGTGSTPPLSLSPTKRTAGNAPSSPSASTGRSGRPLSSTARPTSSDPLPVINSGRTSQRQQRNSRQQKRQEQQDEFDEVLTLAELQDE